MDGHAQTGFALASLKRAEPYLPLLSMLSSPVKIPEPSTQAVAVEVRQQLQVDIALLAKDMAEAARELRVHIVHAHEWERALDLEAIVDLVVEHQDMAGRPNARMVHPPPHGQAQGARGLLDWASGSVLTALPTLFASLPAGWAGSAPGHGGLWAAFEQLPEGVPALSSRVGASG